jgi:hypothetical protein
MGEFTCLGGLNRARIFLEFGWPQWGKSMSERAEALAALRQHELYRARKNASPIHKDGRERQASARARELRKPVARESGKSHAHWPIYPRGVSIPAICP